MTFRWAPPRRIRINWTLLACTAAAAGAFALPARPAEKWKVQYFYDKDDSSLAISDLKCPSAQRCIAAGVIQEGGHTRGAVVVTSDGGQHWDLTEVKERPVSLFFLNDSSGWMATDRGIWETNESGRKWKKISNERGVLRLYFQNDKRGWAVGSAKIAVETGTGGSYMDAQVMVLANEVR